MMHRGRTWVITDVSPNEVPTFARQLTEIGWCMCQGFRLSGYLFLNDSTGPDGAQEYAILREDKLDQIESITFSWMDALRAEGYIRETLAGAFDAPRGKPMIQPSQIQTPEQHGRCQHCA